MIAPKHILITGASSGIGAALALEYAAPGVTLSLLGRNAERLGLTATRATAKRAMISPHVGDVTDAEGLAAWMAERHAEHPIDLVIANAGLSGRTAHVEELTAQTKTLFNVNVQGGFNTVHPALSFMKKRGCGQIALVSSLAGFRGFPGAAGYAASKAAIRVYGEALRVEMAPFGVEINVICPGFVKTPMTDVNQFKMPFLMSPERAARLIRKGLSSNRGRIAFPSQTYTAIQFLSILPQALTDALAARMPRK